MDGQFKFKRAVQGTYSKKVISVVEDMIATDIAIAK
jgi:hypothetical protein